MRLFNEINWSIQEINRFNIKFSLNISKQYLEQIINQDLIFNNGNVIENMLDYGFIKIESNGKHMILTELGNNMLELAEDKYSLSQQQKELASQLYINKNKELSKIWFNLFTNNNNVYRNNIDIKLQQYTENMLSLNVATQKGKFIFLNQNYYKFINNFDSESMTEKELMEILKKNSILGAKAEQIAFYYEKKRLKRIGKKDLADKVKLIAKENIKAGYDIESFESINSHIYDRFIEVKYFNNKHFYLSQNELKVAEILNNRYYIYLVDTDDGNIQIIKNPYNCLDKIAKKIETVCTKFTF